MPKTVGIREFIEMPIEAASEAIAYAFAHKYKGRLYYHTPQKKWFWRLGTKWQKDRTALALDFARIICREFNPEGKPSLGKASLANKLAYKVERKARLLFSDGGYNAGDPACPEITPPTPQELAQ